jgi:hypothetical protein
MLIKNKLNETFIFLENKEDIKILEKQILKYKSLPFQQIKIQFKKNNFNDLNKIFIKNDIKIKNKFSTKELFFVEI